MTICFTYQDSMVVSVDLPVEYMLPRKSSLNISCGCLSTGIKQYYNYETIFVYNCL
jgi:hypothetical protein